jgi:hypothetical protein
VRKTFSSIHKLLLGLTFIGLVTTSTVFAASSTLHDYFYETGKILPNTMSISISETVTFNDNYNKGTREKSHSAWEFNTDLNIDLYRTLGNVTYGLQGSVGWNHYHNSHREAEPDIDLSPYVEFAQDKGNLMLSGGVTYKDETLSNSDRRFAKYYDAVIRAAYDLNSHERYGAIISGDYAYQYYTESKFSRKDNAKYGISLAPYYVLSPKTKLGLRLGYQRTDYRSNREHDDLDELFLNLFVNYHISLKVNLTAEAGATRTSYDGGPSAGTPGDDDINPNYRLGVTYNMLSNLAFSLMLSHNPKDSFELDSRGLSVENESRLGMVWTINPKLQFTQSLAAILKDEKNSTWDSRQYEYAARLNYTLRERLKLHAGYTYTTTHFKYEEDSNFKSNEVSLGLSWQF